MPLLSPYLSRVRGGGGFNWLVHNSNMSRHIQVLLDSFNGTDGCLWVLSDCKGSGYSYGTRTETCICYSYGSQKISIEFLCNCRLLLIQIIVFTFRRIKRFQWVPFLWARLICVLSATHSRHFNFHDVHVTRLERTVQRLVFAIHTGFLWVCWVSVKVVIKFTNR